MNKQTDKELLELAAKAAGYALYSQTSKSLGTIKYFIRSGGIQKPWNPLEHDGDAFRLAVLLKLAVQYSEDIATFEPVVEVSDTNDRFGGWFDEVLPEVFTEDTYASVRRCIVRAAAEIGKGMK